MEASYSYSTSRGDAESFLSDNGDDPSLTEFEPGFLDYDQRHVLKLNAIAYLPRDWRIGGTAQWASGLPFSFIDLFDAEDNVGYVQSRRRFGFPDPDRGFITEHRNVHRNHAAYNFNARAQRSFVVGRTSASAFFEVFNILNSGDLPAPNQRFRPIDARIRPIATRRRPTGCTRIRHDLDLPDHGAEEQVIVTRFDPTPEQRKTGLAHVAYEIERLFQNMTGLQDS